jgi:hypothetical protein
MIITYYSSNGFFRIQYPVPKIRKDNNSTYQVNLYLANKLDFKQGIDVKDILLLNQTRLMASFFPISIPSPEPLSFAAQYKNYILIGLASAIGFLVLSAFGAWKLHRYRPKYHSELKRAQDAEDLLNDIQAEELIPGGRDFTSVGGAVITRNVLHEANAEIMELEEFHNEYNPSRKLDSSKMNSKSIRNAKIRKILG